MKKTEKARLLLIEAAIRKHNQLVSGSVFKTDFGAADIIKKLITEVKILSLENKNFRKVVEVKNFQIEKKESEIKSLQETVEDLKNSSN